MSAILSERPFFPPASKQGGTASVNAAKILREAQAAFFRPSAAVPAGETKDEPVIEAVSALAAPTIKRPGSLLDIRV